MHHVYVHVPFCRRRCVYCDFAIAVRRSVPGEPYVRTVLRELDLVPPAARENIGPLETLYLGGGTPSLLGPDDVAQLVTHLIAGLGVAPDAEVTLEANPEDVRPETAAQWRACGVNRVSLGVQSFDDAVLRWMHRPHNAAAAERAVRTLRDAGFENLSLDLIFGLPEMLDADFGAALDHALNLEPDHLSLYGLTVEPRTPLSRQIARGTVRAGGDERYAREFLRAHEVLTAAGFEHYEVSNYAHAGRRSRHNQAYWFGRPYLGLGPAAHSFDGEARWWNLGAWTAYERALADGRRPTDGVEHLTPEQRRLEAVLLELRTDAGVSRARLSRWPHPETERAVADGWLVATDGRVKATPEGWLRLDQLAVALTT